MSIGLEIHKYVFDLNVKLVEHQLKNFAIMFAVLYQLALLYPLPLILNVFHHLLFLHFPALNFCFQIMFVNNLFGTIKRS
jgi:hypothetical protein